MDHIRRYIDDTTAPTTPCGLSIGSPSQRFFDSESDNDDHRYGTCNGYNSHPGSKSNLLFCMQCDLEARSCSYRPRTLVSHFGKSIEEERALRCDECAAAKQSNDCHCMHCDYSLEEADLICFRCENEEDQTTEEEGALCSKCEASTESPGQSGSNQVTSSSSENDRYPVDAVVKIQVNDKSLDDSDDTTDESSALVNREATLDTNRLSPIVEHIPSDSNDKDDDNQLNTLKLR